MAEVTFPPHNAAEYIEHAQLLAMDYPIMLTADAVRNKRANGKLAELPIDLLYKIAIGKMAVLGQFLPFKRL